jgi:hypothetical protein
MSILVRKNVQDINETEQAELLRGYKLAKETPHPYGCFALPYGCAIHCPVVHKIDGGRR